MKKKKITFKIIIFLLFLFIFLYIAIGSCRRVNALELVADPLDVNISQGSTNNGLLLIFNGEPSLSYPSNTTIKIASGNESFIVDTYRDSSGYSHFDLYEISVGYIWRYTKPHNISFVIIMLSFDAIDTNLNIELFEIYFDLVDGYHYELVRQYDLYNSNLIQELYETLTLPVSVYFSGLVGVWFYDFRTQTRDNAISQGLLQIQVGNIATNAEEHGYEDGYNNGYELGYNTGYDEGQAGENATPVVFAVLTGVFQALGAFLSIELLPHLTIGLFFALPLFFAVVGLILWIWRRH